MKIKRKLDAESDEKFWNVASSAKEEVQKWPEWKKKVDVYDYVVDCDDEIDIKKDKKKVYC